MILEYYCLNDPALLLKKNVFGGKGSQSDSLLVGRSQESYVIDYVQEFSRHFHTQTEGVLSSIIDSQSAGSIAPGYSLSHL